MESNISMTHLKQHLAHHLASRQLLALVTDVDKFLFNVGLDLNLEEITFLLRDHHQLYLSFSKIYRPTVDARLFKALEYLKFGDLSSISAPISIFTHPPGGFSFCQEPDTQNQSRPNDDNFCGVAPSDEDEQGESIPQGVPNKIDEYVECLILTVCDKHPQDTVNQDLSSPKFEDRKRRCYLAGVEDATQERDNCWAYSIKQLTFGWKTALECMNARKNLGRQCLASTERLVFDRGKFSSILSFGHNVQWY